MGAGYWGSRYLTESAGVHETEVVAVCDSSAEALERASKTLPRAYATRELSGALAVPCDAVIVATPSETHGELALAALRANKHVLVEKPLATRAAEAKRLVEEAQARRLVLGVGHLVLLHPAMQWLFSACARGDIGELLTVHSVRHSNGSLRRHGSDLWELGPHDVAVALRLVGRLPRAVRCDRSSTGTTLFLDFSGVSVTTELSRAAVRPVRAVTVTGTKGTVELDELRGQARVRDLDGRVLTTREFQQAQSLLQMQLARFAAAVAIGDRPRADGAEALKVVEVLCSAERDYTRAEKYICVAMSRG